jgi:hypothetical protein
MLWELGDVYVRCPMDVTVIELFNYPLTELGYLNAVLEYNSFSL